MASGVQKIVIHKSRRLIKQKFNSRLMADNGNILWVSEKYLSLAACEVPALNLSLRLNIPIEYDFEHKDYKTKEK